MTVVLSPETELDKCVVCGGEIGDEKWFLASTGEQGARPREKFELVLCAECTRKEIPQDFQKLVVTLFDRFG